MGLGSIGKFIAPATRAAVPLAGEIADKTPWGQGMTSMGIQPSSMVGGLLGKMGMGGGAMVAPGQDGAPGTPGGAPGTEGGFNIESFIQDNPMYKFLQGEGIRGLERSAAAKGQFGSGNLMKDLVSFSSGLASQSYNTEMDRVMKMAGVEAGSPAAAGQNYATSAGAGAQAGQQGLLGLGKIFSLFQ